MVSHRAEEYRLEVLKQWTQAHARRTSSPGKFMSLYDHELAAVRKGDRYLDESPDYSDPIRLAAEIEALAAVRCVRQWPLLLNIGGKLIVAQQEKQKR